jgi:hypothetical protein
VFFWLRNAADDASFISDLRFCDFFQHGVNLKHPEYFADSPSAGMAPSTREE